MKPASGSNDYDSDSDCVFLCELPFVDVDDEILEQKADENDQDGQDDGEQQQEPLSTLVETSVQTIDEDQDEIQIIDLDDSSENENLSNSNFDYSVDYCAKCKSCEPEHDEDDDGGDRNEENISEPMQIDSSDEDDSGDDEEKCNQIDEHDIEQELHRIWRRNANQMYKFLLEIKCDTRMTSVDWFEQRNSIADDDDLVHRFVAGTTCNVFGRSTSPLSLLVKKEEKNFLIICDCKISRRNLDRFEFREEDIFAKLRKTKSRNVVNDENDQSMIDIRAVIPHPGRVRCVRSIPSSENCSEDRNLIASISGDKNELFVYDISDYISGDIDFDDHDSIEGKPQKPSICLRENTAPPTAFDCGPTAGNAAQLISCSGDGKIVWWDIGADGSANRGLTIYHDSAIHFTDIAWHRSAPTIFAASSNDGYFGVFDRRDHRQCFDIVRAHDDNAAIHSIAYSPFDECSLLTASADRTVKLWTAKRFTEPIITTTTSGADQDAKNYAENRNERFDGPQAAVTAVRWSPHVPNVFACCSADHRVYLYDIGFAGRRQSLRAAAQRLPSSVFFVHGGHRGAVRDFRWSPNCRWLAISVADGVADRHYDLAGDGVSMADYGAATGTPSSASTPATAYAWLIGEHISAGNYFP